MATTKNAPATITGTKAKPTAKKVKEDEERLDYMGSVVLGLNDALVELTGALAGSTFAMQNSRLIALAGLIILFFTFYISVAKDYSFKDRYRDLTQFNLTPEIIVIVRSIIPQYRLC